MSTRTTLSYAEKKETLSVECKTQGLSSKTENTRAFKFVQHLRAKGKREQVPRQHDTSEASWRARTPHCYTVTSGCIAFPQG